MAELTDDEVSRPQELSDDAVMQPQASPPAPELPQAFLDRLRAGNALSSLARVSAAAAKGAKEDFGPEPIGMSPEHVQQLQQLGVYRDPATGRGGALRLFNESILQPAAVVGDLLVRGAKAAIGGIAGGVGELASEAPGASGATREQASNEVENFLNYALLRGDQFARMEAPEGAPPHDQTVGIIPRDQDFKNGAFALHKQLAQQASGGPPPDMETTEANLRDLWETRGIHPAEAVHDAQSDALLRHQLTTPAPDPADRSGLPLIEGSPIQPGTPRSELAKTGEDHIDTLLESADVKSIIDNPTINRANAVPYTAGASSKPGDPTINIDRRFPKSFTIDGVTFDPAEPFTVHETVEKSVMDLLTKGGMTDEEAYRVAHFEYAEKAEGAWYKANGIDQAKAEAAYAPYMAFIQHVPAKDVPSNLYKKPYPHDNPSAALKEPIAEPKPSKDEISRAKQILGQSEEEGKLRALGADVAAPMTPLAQQPVSRSGALMASIHDSVDKLFDIGRDLQMKFAPMAVGSREAQATAKDFANALRKNRWDWSRQDDDLVKRFSPEQRKRMWDAADEESVLRQEGKGGEHMGLATLTPEERAAVESFSKSAQITWMQMKDLGMVKGEGLPVWTPRAIVNAANAVEKDGSIALNRMPQQIGQNLRTQTSSMRHRKYLTAEETEAAARQAFGDEAAIVRDIRVLPMSIAKEQDAIAGRKLINAIREYGKRTGDDVVAEGGKPADSLYKWFTVDHPAFKTLRKEIKTIEIPGQSTTVGATHEMGIDPGLQAGLERVAKELGISIKQPLRQQDPYLKLNPTTSGYTSRIQPDVVSTFGNAQTIIEHELGHKIDFRYGLSREMAQNPAVWRELGELALHRVDPGLRATFRAQPDFLNKLRSYRNYSQIGSYDDYLLSAEERIANLLHAYWYTPKLLQQIAPNASKWFENFLSQSPDGLKQAIKSVEPSLRVETKRLQEQSSVIANPTSISVDQWKQVPIFVRGDFEGPLTAVLSQRSGAAYSALMSLKGKTMGLIMNSPLIHNAVEWGRALPAMPGKVATFKVYFEGNRAMHDPELMREAIDAGLVPIGHRFFNQDISSIMEAPSLKPGRSWTAQILAAVPDLFDPAAGDAVRRAIDKAGNFWHNTLLWDNVARLQMGLYTNFRDEAIAKGVDQRTATIMAAHFANRFAGALPEEAMSANARKIANMLLFSRSFTLGNLGVMKDVVTGLPQDIRAQIERDVGNVDPNAANYAAGLARRRAAATVAMDIALFYVGNSLIQSAMNVLLGDNSLSQELHNYVQRFVTELDQVKENPMKLLQPFDLMQGLTPQSENEPRSQDRAKVGYAKDGTAIYARNPAGKIGEEFTGYLSGPLDMLRRKLGTIARPAYQILNNDAGFGRKIYDPDAKGISGKFWNVIVPIVEHIAGAQLPEGQIQAFHDLVKGEGDEKVNMLQAFGPLGGVTFSKGAPGGPAIGEMFHAREEHDFAVQRALPDIRRQIKNGDLAGAQQAMVALGIPKGLRDWYVRTTINPSTAYLSKRALDNFYNYATPEERQRFENAR